ncbi:hypothetical protein E5161_14530 [Cohnella pontilimi]|uniref:Uncharacterized protein n=1 Tax=Cohnella pontilimi TaxID=2564100 RepID=A0A4V5LRX5_9BACL|nr:hypothetical protein [Cohnella pontilimi]TJY40929.1 hypothetical protein E5161_14530 [Cohnella pontilimi]
MKKQSSKTLAWSTAVLTLMLIGTACSGGSYNNSEASSSPSAAAALAPSASASPSESPSASASPSASSSPELKTATGEYVGLSDPHSIEIKVDGKSENFQISPESADKISSWENGTKVSFQYMEQELDVDGQKVKQLIITVIDKA